MCIDALLNPADESRVIDEMTEEEICQAVLEARKEREQACNNDAPANPRPARACLSGSASGSFYHQTLH